MSEDGVNLSKIRGDWKFHMDYLQNAFEQTLKREASSWAVLGGDAVIATNVQAQQDLWAELKASANDAGTINTTDGKTEEFIVTCRASKSLCDAYEDGDSSAEVEEFAETCRQTRALCDDLAMMKEQRPDGF
ncbi:MAG: hypothetical protein E2O52_07930 [Gammaproteobacteria bacterium]|nr:MAG: hypothetical protein E2O52_07930 [Gammaproteobacteria bacterium]